MKQKNTIDMINGPMFKNIWIYTVPVIFTGVLQLLFNAADLVVVGRFCGSVCVAAVGATGAVINLVTNLFIGLSVGVGVTVATALGAGNERRAQESIHTAIPVGFLGGLLLAVIGFFVTHPLLRMMGTPEDVIDLSALYMKIYFCGMPSSLLYNYGASVLRADGDTKKPLVYLTIAGVLNVLLNLVFVRVFHMTVDGVALATIISQTISATLVLLDLSRREDACRFDPKKMCIKEEPLEAIIRIGLPAGLQSSMFSISNVIIQSSVNSFGSVVMAGNAAAANIEGFLFTALNAFSQAALNFTGQNCGAGRLDNIPKIRKCCLLDVILVGEGLGIPTFIFGEQLLSIYITDSPQSIQYGIIRMSFLCLCYGLNGLHDVSTGTLRGLGYSFVPMVVTVFGICVFRVFWIFTIFRIEQFHTLEMLFITYPISWLITFLALTVCYKKVYKKKLEEAGNAA